MSTSAKVVPLVAPRPCPICAKKSVAAYHPFCSRHCADVDLNRWLKGSYAIPGEELADHSARDAGDGAGQAQSADPYDEA